MFEQEVITPNLSTMERFFSATTRAIQIVAPGGAGKTTFAMQICRWCLGGETSRTIAPTRRLPIWLDREVEDLPVTLKEMVAMLLPEEQVDMATIDLLVGRGRIFIVADRLSEQERATSLPLFVLGFGCSSSEP